MVKFAWSWADYERCKREEERKAAQAREAVRPTSPTPPPPTPRQPRAPKAPTQGGFKAVLDKIVQEEREKRRALETQRAETQLCDLCGKRRLRPCADRGCPIL